MVKIRLALKYGLFVSIVCGFFLIGEDSGVFTALFAITLFGPLFFVGFKSAG